MAGTFELSASETRQQQTKTFLKNFRHVSFFQLINSASAFFINILIARLVGPEVFGDFFFFVSTALVATILFDFGLTRTLLRYSAFHQARGEISEKLSYYAAVLRLKTLLGISIFVVLGHIEGRAPENQLIALGFSFAWLSVGWLVRYNRIPPVPIPLLALGGCLFT